MNRAGAQPRHISGPGQGLIDLGYQEGKLFYPVLKHYIAEPIATSPRQW